jgi:8-oxo-dGTP pyrophosphatase MutT (NUDIX family)
MEQVDILDTNFNILYLTSKQEAHEKGLLHACVISQLIDSEGRWILVKQNSHKQDAGQYVSPVGGHIQAKESELDALKRESMEEVGIEHFEYKFIGKKIYNREVIGRKENHVFVLYEIYSDIDPILNDESVEFVKFTVGDLKKELQENPKHFGDAFWFVVENFYPELLK